MSMTSKRTLEEIKGQDEKKVEALCLADDIQQPVRFSYAQLCSLKELRVLRLSRAKLYGNLPKIAHGQNRAPRKKTLPELRWLSWKGRVKDSFLRPLYGEGLAILDLSSSGISFTESTECWRKFFKGVKRLKVLDLSGCSGNNELLNVLVELKSLTELLVDGTGIITLPEDLMKQLEVLSANDCKNLERIPQFEESSRMRVMPFKGCEKVSEIPDSIGNLLHLEERDLSGPMVKEIPASLGGLWKLKVLRMRRTFVEEVPEVVNEMGNQEGKDFSECRSLKGRAAAAAACDV